MIFLQTIRMLLKSSPWTFTIVYIFKFHFFKVHFNIILPASFMQSRQASFSFRISDKNSVRILIPTVRATSSTHLILFHSAISMITHFVCWRIQIMNFLMREFPPAYCCYSSLRSCFHTPSIYILSSGSQIKFHTRKKNSWNSNFLWILYAWQNIITLRMRWTGFLARMG